MFVDRVEIEVSAGRGGDGCVSFRREKFVPRGGPDGGNGGNGGSVIVEAQDGVDHLSALAHRKHWNAKNGRPGMGSNRHGKSAEDLTIRVPPGTLIIDKEQGFTIKDLDHDGASVVVGRGGKGGKGNAHFKSATNRTPREHTEGEDGEQRRLVLELKMIADVGLIGRPNAGKSTLLSRLSRARPEIADYPFTTKHPNLGLVQIDLERSFVMADIPGLIEGASEGVGLGHEFLRHIERAGILVHLVEPMPIDGTDPLENYTAIHKELIEYDLTLDARPEIVCVTKAELPGADEIRTELAKQIDREVLLISAVTGAGMNDLNARISQQLWPGGDR